MKPLRGYEIVSAITLLPLVFSNFQTIVDENAIPKFIKNNHFVIVNKKNHWIVIFKNAYHKCYEVFDSLGADQKWLQNFLEFRRPIQFNVTRFQSLNSNSCALFVIVFLHHRILNLDCNLTDILELMFTKKISKNETYVRREYRRIKNGFYSKHTPNINTVIH